MENKKFEIIELFINEDEGLNGVFAVSIVQDPAMESEFMLFGKEYQVKFKTINSEERLVMGALLIPNKMILRDFGDHYAYVYFSPETVKQSSQLYMQKGNQNNATIEHMVEVENLTMVESWIIEDAVHDKSRKYGMQYPVGTWMGTMKINDDTIWDEVVKTGMVKGFSIEGDYQKGRTTMSNEEKILEKLKQLLVDFDENETK